MIIMREHVQLLLIAALLGATVGVERKDTFVECLRICSVNFNNCKTYFRRQIENLGVCMSSYYNCIQDCLKDHCPDKL
ncbi:hypothetical protein LSAT2_029517 [Lamellibrachia satsuma]|nr:hypothetical protein LSAT2_029517 [Lamellibrachia satsuma]